MSVVANTKRTAAVRSAILIIDLFFWGQCWGQGTFQPLHISFEGPPIQPPGTSYAVQLYTEAGMSFTQFRRVGTNVFSSPFGFARTGSGGAGRPDNGTAYLQAGSMTDTLVCMFTNGGVFDLLSADLAEYSTVVPDAVTAHLVGYRLDGSTVVFDRTTDGIMDGTGPLDDFQTFHFQGFTGLSRLELSTTYASFSLDNLVVAIPEPTSRSLLVLGALILLALRLRKKMVGVPRIGY